jgi:biopolymer transport protein ExbB/TolQ
MWGLMDLLLKSTRLPVEFKALREKWLPPSRGREPIENATLLLEKLHALPAWQQESRQGRWLREMLEVIADKGSAQTCREDHQRILDRESEKLHNEYGLVRFVTGVTPILGFLGTVVHFGTALSGMSFDNMTARLPDIVGEMGMAFNTTTVALAASMTTMMGMFFCERIERGLMRSTERYIEREILSRFESREQPLEPLLRVLQSAHETALSAISHSLDGHLDRWAGKIDGLLKKFDAHQGQAASAWQTAQKTLQEQHEAHFAQSEERFREILNSVDSAESKHLAMIQIMLEEAATFREDIAGFTRTLELIAKGEGKLAEVQDTLSTNLSLLQQSGQIDEALHGLTAAIHILTARHRPGERDAA